MHSADSHITLQAHLLLMKKVCNTKRSAMSELPFKFCNCILRNSYFIISGVDNQSSKTSYILLYYFVQEGGRISLILRFLKSHMTLSDLNVAIRPEFVII